VDGANGLHHLVGRSGLEEVAAGAGLDGAEDVLVAVEAGEDDDLRVGVGLADGGDHVAAAHGGHAQVHQEDVRAVGGERLDGRGAVGRLAQHLHVGLGLDEGAQAQPHQGVVVGHHHSYLVLAHAGFRRGSG
jgi:hypothetical protein